ncbi:MAG: hypothetical protein EXQ79_08000 [Acidimicrobiia bacterium]|nr:hypothetical protein [Acidimicrobiia bacterium]
MIGAPATYVARQLPGLPALGWCATVRRGAAKPEVVLGELVETSADTFFEGVWDGPFPELGFLESPVVMGSGGRVGEGAIHCCSPTHTLDHLYCLSGEDSVLVANSLPLLLACAGDAPDPRYRQYRADITALWRGGTQASPIALPTARGGSVLVYAGTDLTVAADLSIELVDKPQVPEPSDFGAYYEMLAGAVERLVANGTDPQRRSPLHPVTTLSSGYDSAASAVLGAKAGVADAITLQHARFDDSGAQVAQALGLHLEVLDRDAWQRSDKPLEIEFMASNGGPSVPTLAGFDGRWPAPMILLGSLGDQMWDLSHPLMGDAQSIPDGLSLTPLGLHDFRLRSGITFVHVPAIGAVHASAVGRISRSAEMEPWKVGRYYDRPVARQM